MDSASSTPSPVPDWAEAADQTNGYDPRNHISSPLTTTLDSRRSHSAVAIRAFLLGLAFGTSLIGTLSIAQRPPNPLWRASCFLASLSAFHFLEFYITALYNTPATTTSAFLLTSNGYAYNMAHTLALLECIFRNYVAPLYYPKQGSLQPLDALLPAEGRATVVWLTVGFMMLLVGQATRTLAMMHAGTNFNHLVQCRKKEGHVLVTDGIYRWLRHPSYFGFFWWGLGTQIIMGNTICLIGYALVLWRFFNHRIESKWISVPAVQHSSSSMEY